MLEQIGQKLVKCNLNCEGITNKPELGIIPRCLFLQKRTGKKGCIIVGINPGHCRQKEKDHYLKNGISYSSVQGYFDNYLVNRPYFRDSRSLITLLGYDGDIIWTDLAKCECAGKNKKLPIQTLRVCIDNFFRKEVEISESSTIFALGNIAFDFCALSFPNHFIVGLPHPTGSYGNFRQFQKKVVSNISDYKKLLLIHKDSNNNYKALHLSKANS